MNKFFSVLIILVMVNLFGCEQNHTEIACDIKDPVYNLPWLKAKIEAFEKSNICANNACTLKIYKVIADSNQQLIVTWLSGPAVDGIPQYFTCNGELIICTEEDPCPNLNNAEIIWLSKAD